MKPGRLAKGVPPLEVRKASAGRSMRLPIRSALVIWIAREDFRVTKIEARIDTHAYKNPLRPVLGAKPARLPPTLLPDWRSARIPKGSSGSGTFIKGTSRAISAIRSAVKVHASYTLNTRGGEGPSRVGWEQTLRLLVMSADGVRQVWRCCELILCR